ncbi:hypothetical protein [Nocardia pseudovaccinii]|uniref:hypothetical protein n=1 Tax=Nocardia pseudovaccinii TaxID=189540 RepID=UPI000AF3AD3A|nr:hypothetical protein [Nocardia pseudovaccinii]
MNGNTNFSAMGVAVNAAPVMSASRGILAALQGIGLSGVGVSGDHGKAMSMHSPIYVVNQDKPSAGWHPAFAHTAEVGVFAVEAGYAPADLQARLRRTAHPATVIRIRQRCRTR